MRKVMRRFILAARVGAIVALATCLPRLCEAGVQNIPCRRPFVFQGAAVNVVVLPYQAAPGLTSSGDLGEHLAGLLQLEVLRAIAKFGSVGAVQMVGSAADCDPELVIARLLGRTPGAAATVRKGNGLVVVWGRFYREGGNVYVQTFCRFLRFGTDETLELTAAGRRFSAQVSGQAFACPPRKVSVADLANFEEQFRRSTIVRQAPQETASGSPMPQAPLPYWISDTQGDWMKIAAQDGLSGWIRLSGRGDSWSLTRWLPELSYIEGMVGYLRTRIALQQSAPVRAEWISSTGQALAAYDSAAAAPSAEGAAPGPGWRTALSSAVQLQLSGILLATSPRVTADDSARAMQLFEQAAKLLPQDGSARNLAAVMQLSLALYSTQSGVSPMRAADALLQGLSADPGNVLLLANLENAYEVLLAPQSSGSSTLTDDERRTVSERLAAIKKMRGAKPG
jgi:hypothetical protein